MQFWPLVDFSYFLNNYPDQDYEYEGSPQTATSMQNMKVGLTWKEASVYFWGRRLPIAFVFIAYRRLQAFTSTGLFQASEISSCRTPDALIPDIHVTAWFVDKAVLLRVATTYIIS